MSKFHKDTDWLDFHSNPCKPSFIPPTGAVDAHCHVFAVLLPIKLVGVVGDARC